MAKSLTKGPRFENEAALCAAFIASVQRDNEAWKRHGKGGWTVYPETGGFDILLVYSDGTQIGIEAKLALNVKVVTQAMSRYTWDAGTIGPDFRAVLVPDYATGDLTEICNRLGITVIRQPVDAGQYRSYRPDLPRSTGWRVDSEWHCHWPMQRTKVPDYVPDVRAGTSAPMTLSDWKVKAIKAAIILEERPVTRADFKALQMNATRWLDRYHGWLKPNGDGTYSPKPTMPDFKLQHPTNYEEIKADKQKWMPLLFEAQKPFKKEVAA